MTTIGGSYHRGPRLGDEACPAYLGTGNAPPRALVGATENGPLETLVPFDPAKFQAAEDDRPAEDWFEKPEESQ